MKCQHEITGIRRQQFANGKCHLRAQCVECGQLVGPFHPQNGIDIESVPFVDYALIEQQRERERQEQHQREAQRERDRLDRHLLYESYLKSPKWAGLRAQVLARDGGLCQGCLQRPATEVHHMKYDHAFNELAFELVSVCRDCHERIHGIGERRDADVSRQLAEAAERHTGHAKGSWHENGQRVSTTDRAGGLGLPKQAAETARPAPGPET